MGIRHKTRLFPEGGGTPSNDEYLRINQLPNTAWNENLVDENDEEVLTQGFQRVVSGLFDAKTGTWSAEEEVESEVFETFHFAGTVPGEYVLGRIPGGSIVTNWFYNVAEDFSSTDGALTDGVYAVTDAASITLCIGTGEGQIEILAGDIDEGGDDEWNQGAEYVSNVPPLYVEADSDVLLIIEDETLIEGVVGFSVSFMIAPGGIPSFPG